MHTEYLIIGQGLCGTLLSWQLKRAGKTVKVMDDQAQDASSRVAGGIVNPVTGKRLVQSWMIESLLPALKETYAQIGQELGCELVHPISILDIHATPEAAALFRERVGQQNSFLSAVDEDEQYELNKYFRFNYGAGKIAPAYAIGLRAMLNGWRKALAKNGDLVEVCFSSDKMNVTETEVTFGEIKAEKIIFCDGALCSDNPYFKLLPWSADKGEVLIADIPDLPRENLYRYGISILPWHNGLFWVGASHDWNYTAPGPTNAFKERTEKQLSDLLRTPFSIVDHKAALRPVNFDRKPFIGFHPKHKRIGIFNGFGGKGCSLAPYFAAQFREHLVNNTALMPDVDIIRYSNILSRTG